MPKSKKTKKKKVVQEEFEELSASDSSDEEYEPSEEDFEDSDEAQLTTSELASSADGLGNIPLFSADKPKLSKENNKHDEQSEDHIPVQAQLVEKEFTSDDQKKLSENEHFRFVDPSNIVGHALVTKSTDGKLIAQQFEAPGSTDPNDPRVQKLKDIEIFQDPYGARRARAKTEDGTEMISKRSVKVKTSDEHGQDVEHELLLFSPKANHIWRGDVFWGSNPERKPALFRDDLSEADKAELRKEVSEAKVDIRGGDLDVVHQDVALRENMKRKPDQNTVMGGSAIDAYEDYYNQHRSELSDEMKGIVKRSVDARDDLNKRIKGQYRPEWLHALGFGLTPVSKDPQKKNNLGAARKCDNTSMMTTERAVKWHAMNRPNSKIHLDCKFKMLPHSDLVDQGMIIGTIQENDNTVELSQFINPHTKYPVFSKPTDLMQTTMLTHYLLSERDPVAVDEVKIQPRLLKTYHVVTQPGGYGASLETNSSNNTAELTKASESQHVDARPTSMPETLSQSSVAARESVAKVDDLTISPAAELTSVKSSLPTSFRHQKSVVKIMSTFQEPDYEMPWLGSIPKKCTGSGFVVSHLGKHYVVTNAHVVDDTNYLQVRIANEDKSFEAKPLQISYQADLAILEITDDNVEEFEALTEPVEIGGIPRLEEELKVIGFPMGGEELSITKGVVSRIEVDIYEMSGERMLQIQTDSAINPGNSGGPVFSNGKLAGVAFQGYDLAQNLGYFIPTTVLNHFLQDVFSPGPYKGFPTLNIAVQPLSNPALREYYGLKPKQSGVRVNLIDELSDAKDRLLKDDIIVAIDGISIGNDAKVTIPEVGNRIDLNYLFQKKHIGESITLSVLRRNEELNKVEQLEIPIKLQWRPGQTKKVEAPEHEKDPTYYINSGVVFQPLTNNYLETQKGSALASVIIPQVGYITDIPKKTLEEQFVIINQIFDSKYTSGYGDFDNAIISHVNHQPVNNIKDVVKAMESNPNSHHHIQCLDGDVIVLRNMPRHEQKQLMRQYRVHTDRSEDLMAPEPKLAAEVADKQPVKLAKIDTRKTEETPIASVEESVKKTKRKKSKGKGKALPNIFAAMRTRALENTDDEQEENISDPVQLQSLSQLLSQSDDSSETDVVNHDEKQDLFADSDYASDNESDASLDGFIVSDDEVFDDEVPDDIHEARQPLLHMAQKSGRDFTIGEMAFMDTIDRLAHKYGGNRFEVLSEGELSDSESELDDSPQVSRKTSKKPKNNSRRRVIESDSDTEDEELAYSDSETEEMDDAGTAAPIQNAPAPRRSRRLRGLNPN